MPINSKPASNTDGLSRRQPAVGRALWGTGGLTHNEADVEDVAAIEAPRANSLDEQSSILVTTKHLFFFQSNCGKEASIDGGARMPNSEGFSSSRFSEANWLVGLKQEHGKQVPTGL